MKTFKKHMILYADYEGFCTICGINDSCSEDFFEAGYNLVEFGNRAETTCKKCLEAWDKKIEEFNEAQRQLKKMVAEL